MATKIFVNYSGNVLSADKSKALQKRVADALCICSEDVIVLGDVQSISVVDVPDTMTKAREKQEAKEAKEAKEQKEAAEPKESPKLTTHETHKVK